MKFKDLTSEQIDKIKKTYNEKSSNLPWEKRAYKLGEEFGVSERTIRVWAVNLGLKNKTTIEPEQYTQAKKRKFDKTKKRFIITSAQSCTPINTGFFNNLKVYANHINAEILVIPFRYKNTNSVFSKKENENEWWDENLIPYLTLNRHNLNANLVVLGDVPIQPTNVNPLSGLESLTSGESGIVGHTRIHMKTLPVLDSSNPRFLFSTGVVTLKNFSESKSGKIGEFHATFGAVIVELKEKDEFFVRQITADDNTGNFIDLFYEVIDGKLKVVNESLALIKGDIHYGSHDSNVLKKSFDVLVPLIKPKQIILHDIFDGYSINPHEEKNFVKQYEKEINGDNSLKEEINNLMGWLNTLKHLNLVVVFSNHDDFLNRFIINGDPKKNIKNALEYMEYGKILLEGKAPNGLIAYLISKNFKNIKCLGRNDSYKINGWELGVHGMDGVNGSKGGIQQYRRLNSKIITAHAHSPVRLDGALQVGTNTKLRLSYNNGMSSWAHSDIIIHKNNKAQHIFYDLNGNFTTFK